MLYRRQRLAHRVRLDQRADLFELADPGRERAPVAVNDPVELAQQGGGLFVSKVKVHDPHMGSLTFPAESASWPARISASQRPLSVREFNDVRSD